MKKRSCKNGGYFKINHYKIPCKDNVHDAMQSADLCELNRPMHFQYHYRCYEGYQNPKGFCGAERDIRFHSSPADKMDDV